VLYQLSYVPVLPAETTSRDLAHRSRSKITL
jgi:hypothetical protein